MNLYENHNFSQVVNKMELNLFWYIYLTATISIAAAAFVSLNLKKFMEKFKEIRIKQKVTIMPISYSKISKFGNDFGYQTGSMKKFLRFNNSKYNDPMFTERQMAALVIFSFGMVLTVLIFRDFMGYLGYQVNPHEMFVYQTVIFEPVFLNIIIPIAYLISRKRFRRFMFEQIRTVFLNIVPENFCKIIQSIVRRNLCFPSTEILLTEIPMTEIPVTKILRSEHPLSENEMPEIPLTEVYLRGTEQIQSSSRINDKSENAFSPTLPEMLFDREIDYKILQKTSAV